MMREKTFDGYNPQVLNPEEWCPFCLEEVRRGIPEDGLCGHEDALAEQPNFRFNQHPQWQKEKPENASEFYRAPSGDIWYR